MEIVGFGEIIGTITLAKELYDIGRYDIVKNQFYNTLCYDYWYENMYGVISSVFSGFYSDHIDDDETELMIFTDDCLSDYYTYAWEFGKKNNIPYDKNPYVIEANDEVYRQLSFCYSLGWKLLGYTKTKNIAKQSKLIIYIGMCECDSHSHLAYSLVRLYKWFSAKCAEFAKTKTKEEVAA